MQQFLVDYAMRHLNRAKPSPPACGASEANHSMLNRSFRGLDALLAALFPLNLALRKTGEIHVGSS